MFPKRKENETEQEYVERVIKEASVIKLVPNEEQRRQVASMHWNAEENDTASVSLSSLRHNMSSLVEKRMMDGKEYLVAPSVLIVEGVLNGIYYPDNEIAVCPAHWNGRPVLVEHSMDANGMPKTGNDPEEREKRTVGWIFNVNYENKRLIGEVWVDPIKCATIPQGQDVLNKLEQNLPIEVSTGVYTLDVLQEGVFADKPYKRIATNLRGDHLALLPNGKGACSWDDGAGFPRLNSENKEDKDSKTVGKIALFLNKMKEKLGLSSNEMGFNSIFRQLNAELEVMYENRELSKWVYLEEIFPVTNTVVFEVSQQSGRKLYRQKYVATDSKATLTGEPEEVILKQEYVPKENSNQPDNSAQKQNKEKDMNREQLIALLLNSKKFGTKTEDFANVPDTMLQNMADAIKSEPTEEVKANAEAKPAAVHFNTEEDVLKAMPEGSLKDMFQSGLKMHKQQHSDLVASLAANKNCQFAQAELQTMPLETLQKLSALANVPADYSGRAGAPVPPMVPKANSSQVPAMPVIDWSK